MGLMERFSKNKPPLSTEEPVEEVEVVANGVYNVTQSEDVQQFSLAGAIDITTTEDIKNYIIDTMTGPNIVLDVKRVNYVSSEGLRMFYALKKECDKRNFTCEIQNTPAGIYEIFRATGYTAVIKLQIEDE